jgi:hypothetical protein
VRLSWGRERRKEGRRGSDGSKRRRESRVSVAHACNPSSQEAEIERITVGSQSWQIVGETLSQKKQTNQKPFTKKGWWSGSRCRP